MKNISHYDINRKPNCWQDYGFQLACVLGQAIALVSFAFIFGLAFTICACVLTKGCS